MELYYADALHFSLDHQCRAEPYRQEHDSNGILSPAVMDTYMNTYSTPAFSSILSPGVVQSHGMKLSKISVIQLITNYFL